MSFFEGITEGVWRFWEGETKGEDEKETNRVRAIDQPMYEKKNLKFTIRSTMLKFIQDSLDNGNSVDLPTLLQLHIVRLRGRVWGWGGVRGSGMV